MIGKPEWFTTRKFGWGLGVRSKEGLLYILAALILVVAVSELPIDDGAKLAGAGIIVGILLVDTLHIMTKIYTGLDERENKHQLIAETNAAYAGVFILAAIIVYQSVGPIFENRAPDPAVIMPAVVTLLAMSLVKGSTLFYLEHRG